MSMISAQCDELRAMAESVGLAMPQAATLMMEAADTIWELRGSVHRERAEADKLRDLYKRFAEYVSQDRCEGCVYKRRCNDGEIDECWQLTEIQEIACDLGIEVKI